jgi:hypothetical protein
VTNGLATSSKSPYRPVTVLTRTRGVHGPLIRDEHCIQSLGRGALFLAVQAALSERLGIRRLRYF